MSETIRSLKPIVVLALLLFGGGLLASGNASASSLVAQTALDGSTLQPFVASLPVFGPGYNAALPRVDAVKHPYLTVKMKEIEQQVLPGFPKTKVWAYEISDSKKGTVLGPANWPAVTVENRRYYPTLVNYVNELPSFGDGQVQGLVTVDKTIHWADPLNSPLHPCMDNPLGDCATPYTGPVPTVPHLHGAEVPSYFDGGPEAWFTPTGLKGPAYATLGHPDAGEALYLYYNFQEPGTLWFHDHALGATRTNVYSGLAAFYFLRDEDKEPRNLPKGAYEIEMAIQDRQFDTNGQLFFPDGSGALCGTGLPGDPCLNGGPPNNPPHPFWIPEFIGDVAIVNGAPWPVLKVEPRRYRFRLLDGSNARMYNMTFGDTASGETLPPVYVIGSDESYLDSPKKVDKVFIAPGERYDVIVDFTNVAAGQTVTITNDAPVPYPSGLSPVPVTDPITGAVTPADQPQMAKIMQFQVSVALKSADRSCDPAAGACKRPSKMVRLADGAGSKVAGVKVDKVRQLVLKEHEGAGGPLEVLVNNTKWDGMMSPSIASIYASTDGISELPRQGSVELWEIVNLTADAHPMHTHLTQFQVVNREGISGSVDLGGGYFDAWGAAFGYPNNLPAACTDPTNPTNPCPAYGPPLPYNVANADGAFGGNPAISPYLLGTPTPPTDQESGWKDTAKSYPGQVLRILVRWTPTSVPQIAKKSYAGKNFYPFDPTKGPGYVWHCHIIDHEDNEMMRPYKVTK